MGFGKKSDGVKRIQTRKNEGSICACLTHSISEMRVKMSGWMSGQAGLTKDMAEQLAELDAGINDRLFASGEPRTEQNRTATDFEQFADVVANLTVYPDRMRENLDRTRGLVASETVMLALVRAGMDKDDAYQLVQHHALEAWEQGKDFRAALGEDSRVTELLTPEALEACFDYRHHVRHVDVVFQRLGI